MSQLLKSETDVLIVGAGPTGLTMACELLRRGIPCRLIDKSDAPSQTSKALGIQSRTLEVFFDMGIIEKVLVRGTRATAANIYEGNNRLVYLDLQNLQAPYPLDPECELHQTYGAGAESLYLIRPDGYIGFRSQPVEKEPLLQYLSQLFWLKPAYSIT
jgi:hypothetical protein